MSKATNVSDFIGALGGGVSEKVLAKVLTDTGMAVLTKNSKTAGKVTIEITMARMSEDSDTGVKVQTKLSYKMPTEKGDRQENETRESIHYMDPQNGLVDAPPKAKNHDLNPSFESGMPVSKQIGS